MTNPSTPYGFRAIGLVDGSSPNFGIYRGSVNPAQATAMFFGDVLLPLAAGYFASFTAAVPGGAPVGGVAGGLFSWQSAQMRMTARQNWYPGNPTDVVAGSIPGLSVEANPQTVFQVRSAGNSGAAVTQAQVGLNANFTIAAGNTLNGLSGMMLDDSSIGAGVSLPFKIIGIVQAPESDPTAINNEVLVIFNNLSNP